MPKIISTPTRIAPAGNKPKLIDEFIGRVNSGDQNVSIAKMTSPAGWEEPGQTPEFDEFTYVLKGKLMVKTSDGILEVLPNQVLHAKPGEWVQYSTPEGAEYLAICLPAFSPDSVHRDE